MATSAKAAKSGTKAVAEAENAGLASNRLVIILLVVLGVVLILGAGAAWYFIGQMNKAAEQQTESSRPPVFMPLEMFTVNLQSEDTQQFLQVGMTVQVADDAQIDLLKLHMPQVRNRLLILLSSKKPSEILTPEGKKRLTEEIIEQLKQPFTPRGREPQVLDVFFTSFVVQ